MAAGDNIVSAKQKILEGDVGANRANSEAVNTKIGGSINSLIDSSFYTIEATWQGYVSNASLFNLAPIRIRKISDIIEYELGIASTGSAGVTAVDFEVRNTAGALVTNLFGGGANDVYISGNSGSFVLIGKDLETATNFNSNIGGHTVQYGNIALTTINAGYVLCPKITSFATGVLGVSFRLKVREQ